jgi:hypothetical protein
MNLLIKSSHKHFQRFNDASQEPGFSDSLALLILRRCFARMQLLRISGGISGGNFFRRLRPSPGYLFPHPKVSSKAPKGRLRIM